jgi:tRNA A37 threonylcarbamoyltransferase TsaD
LAGHVADTRAKLLQILGETFDTTWGDLFDRGATLQEPARYPSLEEVKRVTGEINRKLYARLEALNDEQLAQPAKTRGQIPSPTK